MDDGIFVRQRHVLRIQSRAFHAIHGEVLLLLLPILLRLLLLLLLLTETPSVGITAVAIADSRLLSFRSVIIFVFYRSRPLVVLVESVKVLDVRLLVLFKVTQNGELARGRRWGGRSRQRRVVLVVVCGWGEKKVKG